MSAHPSTWHYGLVARWWAEFNTAQPDELAWYQARIAQGGEPALDLACGTGRILLPLRRAGIAVDGCDVSADMLALCHAGAVRAGVTVQLYAQAMHTLDLPRHYGTIFICDSFGIGAERAEDALTLRRCHEHLAPGGLLAFSHYLPYENPRQWQYWLPAGRAQLPEPWPEHGRQRETQTGERFEVRTREVALDPFAQRWTRQIRVTREGGGQPAEQEEYTLTENQYFVPELTHMLREAGFSEVQLTAAYSDRAATADDGILGVIARK
jgi:SAM-dependent methyltransferase